MSSEVPCWVALATQLFQRKECEEPGRVFVHLFIFQFIVFVYYLTDGTRPEDSCLQYIDETSNEIRGKKIASQCVRSTGKGIQNRWEVTAESRIDTVNSGTRLGLPIS